MTSRCDTCLKLLPAVAIQIALIRYQTPGSQMIGKLTKIGFTVLAITFALLVVSLAIWIFMKDSGTLLQDVLFCVGAVPIIFFSIGMFGEYFKRSDPSFLLSRSVSNKSPNQRAAQDAAESASGFKSSLNWVLAGVLILIICYLI